MYKIFDETTNGVMTHRLRTVLGDPRSNVINDGEKPLSLSKHFIFLR